MFARDFFSTRSLLKMSSTFQTILFGHATGPIENLSGFLSHHRKPEAHTPAAAEFIESIGSEDVSDRAEKMFGEIRRAFRYKRRELEFASEKGSASIRTPDLEVLFTLLQHPESAAEYRLRTEVGEFRKQDLIRRDSFLSIFEPHCDTVSLISSKAVDLEDLIDRIEEVDELVDYLDYDVHCTELTLAFPTLSLTIFSNEMRFRLPVDRNLRKLLIETEKAVEQLSKTGLLSG